MSTRAGSPSALAHTTAAISAPKERSAALEVRMRPAASGRSGLKRLSWRMSSRSFRLAAKAKSPTETTPVQMSAFQSGKW